MSLIYRDLSQVKPTSTGFVIDSIAGLTRLIDMGKNRIPFMCELEGEVNKLTVGIGNELGCVQHSARNGSPPYLMALSQNPVDDEAFCEFVVANTPTPVRRKFCLPMMEVQSIVSEFFDTGGQSTRWKWDEI